MSLLGANLKRLIFCVTIGVILLNFFFAYRTDAITTTMSVIPSVSNVAPTDVFSINVFVTDVVNFTGWEFYLFYLRAIVNCSAVAEGPFLKTGGTTGQIFVINNNYNSTHGLVHATAYLLGSNSSVSGTGVAATITFKALAPGNTPLSLADTLLTDDKHPSNDIPHVNINGAVQVTGSAPDVAVTSVDPFKTVVGKGYTCKINVSTENQGSYEVTYNVTSYANNTPFASATITMNAGNSGVVTLTWNTSFFAYGNYTLKCIADTLPGEIDTSDNTYTSAKQVHIGVPGDVSSSTPGVYDKIVNMKDVAYLVSLFNSKPSSPNWNSNADINDDGVCNMKDIATAVAYFNQRES